MPNIRIDREVYRRLQELAEPFVDNPNNVLRRLFRLDRDESQTDENAAGEKKHTRSTEKERELEEKLKEAQDYATELEVEISKRMNQSDAKLESSTTEFGASKSGGDRRKVAHRARSGRRKRAPRAPAGTLLPEQEYVEPLLSILSEHGGTAPARQIIDAIGKKLENRLTPTDREKNSSGVVRWQNRIQFVRLKLVEEGLLAKNSPRGIWALTELGRAHLEHGREAIKVG